TLCEDWNSPFAGASGLLDADSLSWKLSPEGQQSFVLPLSLSWTWNTNLPRKRNHLPPGYPLPPPPSLPPSQEPVRKKDTFSSSYSLILLWIIHLTSSYSLAERINVHHFFCK
ncbi:hypothetical protein XENORESO_002551, partial [Xenotaenia resolanae]